MRSRRGNTVLEAAMFIPLIVTLLVSMEQIGKLTYTYYSLKKTLYAAARYIGSQQAVDFCNASDPNIVAGLNFAVTGSSDGASLPLISGLTTDMLTISIERYDPAGQTLTVCDCSNTGCDTGPSAYGTAPDYLIVSLVAPGFSFTPNIPFLSPVAILLTPQVLVPYGGT